MATPPLGALLRAGLPLLDRRLWGEEYRHNPLFVYIAGRGRGLFGELSLAFFPWALLWLATALVGHKAVVQGSIFTGDLLAIYWLRLLLVPVVGAVVGGVLCLVQFRRLIHRLPFEELALTRLEPGELIHALGARPLLVGGLPVLVTLLLDGAFFIRMLSPGPVYELHVYLLAIMAIGYYLGGVATSVGVALMLRAQMYIQGGWQATGRAIGDWFVSEVGAPVWLVILGIGFFASLMPPLAMLMPLLLLAMLFRAENVPGRAIADCNQRWRLWWVNRRRGDLYIMPQWFLRTWDQMFREMLSHESVQNMLITRPSATWAGERQPKGD